MVARSDVVETETVCSCGAGDEKNPIKAYFENKCPVCGQEGVLQVETFTNFEKSNHPDDEDNQDNQDNKSDDDSEGTKIIAKCGHGEYCGQDGNSLDGTRRASLKSVNPNDITEDEDEELSEEEEEDDTFMSGWEGLCDLLKPLDGQAMMVQRGDFVIIQKIDVPTSAKLWAYEGINVVDDSVTITDYTPEIYNTFVVRWGESYENELEFVFEKHKDKFGERKMVIEAKKEVPVTDEDEEGDENSENTDYDDSDILKNAEPTGVLDAIRKKNEETSNNKSNNNSSNSNNSNNNTSNDNNVPDEDGEETTEEDDAPDTKEVPITTREEAIQFGLTQVGKAKREDGHTVELKVIGSQKWQMGEWCHVKLPSFDEDSYMFISKCSLDSSPDSEYINTLTFVDYPPSLGKPSKKDKTENNEDSDSENDLGSENGENSENSENTGQENSEQSQTNDNQNNNGASQSG